MPLHRTVKHIPHRSGDGEQPYLLLLRKARPPAQPFRQTRCFTATVPPFCHAVLTAKAPGHACAFQTISLPEHTQSYKAAPLTAPGLRASSSPPFLFPHRAI